MIGAIAGDIVGSVYEYKGIKRKDFPLFRWDSFFTDDSVLTIAVADAILSDVDYAELFRLYYRQYPNAGYGGFFHDWARSVNAGPYFSFGNGSGMRVSPVGYAFDDLDKVMAEAERSAAVTHNHPEGIMGAQAIAVAVFMARTGASKDEIRRFAEEEFGYNMQRSVDSIRPTYTYDVSCQGSVPESIVCFLDSTDVEDAIRNAVSLGGDGDTMACMAGAIADAFYGGVPPEIEAEVMARLDPDLTAVVEQFRDKYCSSAKRPKSK